jgi:hypothetical protein
MFIDRYQCSTTKSSRLTFGWISDLLNAEPYCVALYQERTLHRPRQGHGCRKPRHIIIHTVRLRCVSTLVPFCLHPSLKDETPHSVGFSGRQFLPRPGAPKVQKRPRQRLRNLWRQCHFRLRRGRRRDRRVGPGIVRSLPTFLQVIFAHLYISLTPNLCSRLAEDGTHSVAVIEAGGFYAQDNGNVSVVPAYAPRYANADPKTAKVSPLVDWGFVTQAQKGLGGRELKYARGKTLGGR